VTPEIFRKVRPLADALMASCSPNEHWEELEALTQEECRALDTIAFECAVCNHWFPVVQMHDPSAAQFTCKECGP